MFTLVKMGASLVALVAFAWFGMTYKLGSQTLFEHLHAIGQTKESQDLVDGTRRAVQKGVVNNDYHPPAAPPQMARDAGAPLERLSSSEQRQLKYLLDKATQ